MSTIWEYLEENPLLLNEDEMTEFIKEAMSRRWISHIWEHYEDYCKGVDTYALYAKAVDQMFPLQGKNILEIASGRHCLLAYHMSTYGANVTAIDPVAKPKKSGFVVIPERFDDKFDVEPYDCLVAFNPEFCLESIVEQSVRNNKKAIIGASNREDYQLNGRNVNKETYLEEYLTPKYGVKETEVLFNDNTKGNIICINL